MSSGTEVEHWAVKAAQTCSAYVLHSAQSIRDCGIVWQYENKICGMQVSYMILQRVTPVTHSVGNCLKRVIVIVASVIVFQNPMSQKNMIGEPFLGSAFGRPSLCSLHRTLCYSCHQHRNAIASISAFMLYQCVISAISKHMCCLPWHT